MDLSDLKLKRLEIDKAKFGRICCFIDYGNVNYWYDKDERDWNDNQLSINQKLIVDIEKLAGFVSTFAEQKRFYYGWNPRQAKNWHIVIKAGKLGFIKNTKPMQFIKHYVGESVNSKDGRKTKRDSFGKYVEIPKGNFDVEISVDSIRQMAKYDTFCLFSGDSDFSYLANFLKKNGKKIIVVASGQIFHTLRESADLYINAQEIKGQITSIKEISPLMERDLDIGSGSAGQVSQK